MKSPNFTARSAGPLVALVALLSLVVLSGCQRRIIERNCPLDEVATENLVVDFNLIEISEGSDCRRFRLAVEASGEFVPVECFPIAPTTRLSDTCGVSYELYCDVPFRSGVRDAYIVGDLRLESLTAGPVGEAFVQWRRDGASFCEGLYEVDAWIATEAP